MNQKRTEVVPTKEHKVLTLVRDPKIPRFLKVKIDKKGLKVTLTRQNTIRFMLLSGFSAGSSFLASWYIFRKAIPYFEFLGGQMSWAKEIILGGLLFIPVFILLGFLFKERISVSIRGDILELKDRNWPFLKKSTIRISEITRIYTTSLKEKNPLIEDGTQLNRYILVEGKGSSVKIGKNVPYAELDYMKRIIEAYTDAIKSGEIIDEKFNLGAETF